MYRLYGTAPVFDISVHNQEWPHDATRRFNLPEARLGWRCGGRCISANDCCKQEPHRTSVLSFRKVLTAKDKVFQGCVNQVAELKEKGARAYGNHVET